MLAANVIELYLGALIFCLGGLLILFFRKKIIKLVKKGYFPHQHPIMKTPDWFSEEALYLFGFTFFLAGIGMILAEYIGILLNTTITTIRLLIGILITLFFLFSYIKLQHKLRLYYKKQR